MTSDEWQVTSGEKVRFGERRKQIAAATAPQLYPKTSWVHAINRIQQRFGYCGNEPLPQSNAQSLRSSIISGLR